MAETKARGDRAGRPKPTKMDAVREAQGKLGKDAKAADIQKYVRDTFGHDMKIDHVYNCLSEIRRQAGKTAKPTARKEAAPAPAAARQTPPPPPRPAAPAGGIELKDIAAAKGLVERLGPARLRELIDLLAR